MSSYPSYYDQLVEAHGILGSVAWVVIFPLGGILIRVMKGPASFWTHAALQMLGYSMYCVTFGTGVYFSYLSGGMMDPHPILGVIIFGFSTLQPFLGMMHHKRFGKVQRRTFLAILHIHLGRMLITAGMINGGLGLLLADDATTAEFQIYGIVAGIMWLIYIVVVSATEIYEVKKWYQSDTPEESDMDLPRADDISDEEKQPQMYSDNPKRRSVGQYFKDGFLPPRPVPAGTAT